MKLSDVIRIWDAIHENDVGALRFCDLERAVDTTVGVENDCLSTDAITANHRDTVI
jgi:hypothetical protein